jgi:hypothetical protein
MVTEYRTLSRAKVPPEWREKRCDCCGKLFVACGSEWSSPRYCSPCCVGEARNERRRAARRHKRRTSKCVVCGTSFQHQRSTRRYCSVRRRVAAHHEKVNRPAIV